MINIITAASRHFSDMDWLKTYWLFSFADYYDPANMNHGTLRVFNDDVVQPHTGFGTHPHAEMEIVSMVLEGSMAHKDTMGNEMQVTQNDVQRMTAGTGLHHSEKNENDTEVRFFQIWILPDKKKLEPSYDQKSFSPEHWQNKLALIASDTPSADIVSLNSKAKIFRADLHKQETISHTPENGTCQFVYVIEGALTINTQQVKRRDQARIRGESVLEITAQGATDFILIEVPEHR